VKHPARPDWRKHIHSDPAILAGKPVFIGTRIPVDLVLENLAAGESIQQILEGYPRLSRDAILSAIGFAAQYLRSDVIYPIESGDST
jgi:uncharacterized protein (DUF433 family)